ncbi:hypothetical protein CR513_18510, partial [Mucuna pruriens]
MIYTSSSPSALLTTRIIGPSTDDGICISHEEPSFENQTVPSTDFSKVLYSLVLVVSRQPMSTSHSFKLIEKSVHVFRSIQLNGHVGNKTRRFTGAPGGFGFGFGELNVEG